ncbi:hypothetical protein IU443_18465 [Nocardia farcinica]|uniref:Uncharacterized protein n=2 Tax=Nocardia farcinica TaxID=37329 RepID=Q5YQD4_NOCFA|nr:hypothetical protein [Nocardia farcinica]AXK87930.1 hypothetical protein DXT66_21975 [Nocardia farcinica]MBF6252580.1 hypothetical protein [Nocardia farcinica]MBF6264352.1 hypothetical protein [Nocardia farcinica]MBF6282498.1 hypothetical protein [Nocardia farcinica]MBF6307618.1 hypothetical protein [Nocardia farcinica]
MTALDKRADAPAEPTRIGAIARVGTMVVLILAALFTLAVEVLYLPIYLGSSQLAGAGPELVAAPLAAQPGSGAVPVPITAVLAAVVNIALVAAMRTLTDSVRVAMLPVMAWTLGFLVCTFPGPGGDLVLMSEWPTLLLLVCGVGAPLIYVFQRATGVAGR